MQPSTITSARSASSGSTKPRSSYSVRSPSRSPRSMCSARPAQGCATIADAGCKAFDQAAVALTRQCGRRREYAYHAAARGGNGGLDRRFDADERNRQSRPQQHRWPQPLPYCRRRRWPWPPVGPETRRSPWPDRESAPAIFVHKEHRLHRRRRRDFRAAVPAARRAGWSDPPTPESKTPIGFSLPDCVIALMTGCVSGA